MFALSGTDFVLPNQTDIYRGRVRDVYVVNNDTLVAVTTDRMSAFGILLPQPIPHKGQVLNLIAAHFLRSTSDIVPNWLEQTPDPNVSIGRACKPFPIEMVIRGCLVGHVWRIYQTGIREICGITLPDGMQEYDPFDEPIITPQTKVRTGHDEDLSAIDIIEHGFAGEGEFERLSIIARQLFIRGRQYARNQGLILADTKYKFGTRDGQILLIDDIHTPDSSRYFYVDEYNTYRADMLADRPRDLSKEFVRQWLLEQGYSGLPGQAPPTMGDELIMEISRRYIELYEQLMGEVFIHPDPDADVQARIKNNILSTLKIMH